MAMVISATWTSLASPGFNSLAFATETKLSMFESSSKKQKAPETVENRRPCPATAQRWSRKKLAFLLMKFFLLSAPFRITRAPHPFHGERPCSFPEGRFAFANLFKQPLCHDSFF
jgi:hypothetical protein